MSAQAIEVPAEAFYNATDLGSMKLFIRHFGDTLRYVTGWGWMVWAGQRWQRDDTAGVWRLLKLLPSAWYQEAARAAGAGLKDAADAYARWARTTESAGKLAAVLKLAESELSVVARPGDFDTDPVMLNCRNGTLHLRTGLLMAHTQVDMITKLAGASYEPSLAAPRWECFLERILPDPAIRAYLQRAVGYSLTGLMYEEVFFLLHGTGANGKSTLLNVLAHVLGDYAQFTRPETFMAKVGDSIPNDVAALAGARMVITTETDEGQRLAESLVKRVTGRDPVVARFFRNEFFTFQPTFKLWLAANHLPAVRGTDYAMWRRIHLIPFTETIPVGERDAGLLENLKAEAGGILAWAARGYDQWEAHGLNPPEQVQAATQAYRSAEDTIGGFLDECCVFQEGLETAKTEFFAAFQAWCDTNNEYKPRHKAFSQRLIERGFTERRTNRQRMWAGVGLLAMQEPPEDPLDAAYPAIEANGHVRSDRCDTFSAEF